MAVHSHADRLRSYLIFGVVVIYWSFDLVALHFRISSIVPGTDTVPSWWFYSATPVGWSVLLFRVAQDVVQDVRAFVSGEPLITQGSFLAID